VLIKDMIRDSLIDTRPFAFGEVWTIKDELVSIPDADRTNDRVLHTIDQCKSRIVHKLARSPVSSSPRSPVQKTRN